ncbi:MAG TPA: type III-B CRISPR module-associated protein Cmr3 [Stellaceae bacterium]|jgi:CRISPR-associated protein Cmr3
MTIRIGLILEPLDVLFFRDGRPFEAGIRVGGQAIVPQTLAGALRTALLDRAGCDFDALGAAVQGSASFAGALAAQSPELAMIAEVSACGPWFYRKDEPLLPVPADLMRAQDGSLARLKPLRGVLPGWLPEEPGLLPLWIRSHARYERASGFLTITGIARYLEGDVPKSGEIVGFDKLAVKDSRVGVVIRSDSMTTERSLIYAAEYLALTPGVRLYAELAGPEPVLENAFVAETAIPLGGQSRYVRVWQRVPVDWPTATSGGEGRLILLTAPAPFSAGWRPEGLDLVAATVPGHVAFSGWDLARRGPKPTRFAAAAGSVYFCRDFPEVGDRTSLCDVEDAALGWGSFLEGVWDYA